MTCTFDTECFDTDACTAADFYLEVVDGEPAKLSTIFGDLDLVVYTGSVWLAEGQGMSLMLSRREDGSARASVHMADAGMVNYAGRCGE